jgi:competence protein ComEC
VSTPTAAVLLAAAWGGALLGATPPFVARRAAVAAVGPAVALGVVGALAAASAFGAGGEGARRGERPACSGRRPPGGARWAAAGAIAVLVVSAAGAAVRTAAVDLGPAAVLVREGARAVEVVGVVVSTTAVAPAPARGGGAGDDAAGRPPVELRLRHVVPSGGAAAPTRERVLLRLRPDAPQPPTGAVVRATGRAARITGPRADSLRAAGVVVAVGAVRVDVIRGPPWWLRPTAAVRDGLAGVARARLPPAEAALLVGLVTGDTTGLPADVEDDVRAAGLSHLVAVSGANIGVATGAVLGLGAVLRISRRVRWWLAGAAVWWLVLLVGPQPSVVRAAAGASLVLAAHLVGRRRSAPHLVCTGLLVALLVDPQLAGRLGFALSSLAVLGVVVLAPPLFDRLAGSAADPLVAGGGARLRRGVAGVLAATCGAQLAVLPLLLLAGLPVHPATVPANLLAAPSAAVAGLLGHAVAVAAVAAPWATGALATAARPALRGVLGTAAAFADGRARTGSAVLAVAVALGLAAWSLRRAPAGARPAVAVAALVAVVAGAPALRPGGTTRAPADPVLVALDVGQGDAVLLGDPVGGWLLVDGGPDGDVVLDALRQVHVGELAAVVATHPHADHVDGLVDVLGELPVGALLVGPRGDRAAELLAAAADARVPVRRVAAGDGLAHGTTRIDVLGPPATGLGDEPNDNSLVLRAETADGVSALLAGDAEVAAQAVLRDDARIDVEVLKVPHHGGATNLPGFLQATSPAVAVISVGEGNPFGHPHADVLTALTGVDVRRTDRSGTVTVPLVRRG